MMFYWMATVLAAQPEVVVGSKKDIEGQLLGEIFAQVIEGAGEAQVSRRLALGGTGIVMAALESGEIDILPEYSGNMAHLIIKEPSLSDFAEIQRRSAALGFLVGPALGFNNTYGIGIKRAQAEQLKLSLIGDIRRHPELRGGFTPEFASADYGWPGLAQRYGLSLAAMNPLEQSIAYAALKAGEIDVTDVYTTDATIEQFDLVVLKDDQQFFARYDGLALAKSDFSERFPVSWAALEKLGGSLNDAQMMKLNARAELDHVPFNQIAHDFLQTMQGITLAAGAGQGAGDSKLWRLTVEHLSLVVGALLLSLLIGLPLGLVAARWPRLGQGVVTVTGLLQTIPSIALLCFLIPIFGVGSGAALVALVLYNLLPIVRGMVTGLTTVDRRLLEVAQVLGMSRMETLRRVELPLASVAILNGIQVSAVTSVGTATLAALIGGGGYGSLIISGLTLNDMNIVLQGAIPSAVMALGVHMGLEALTYLLVPRGLRV